MLPNLTRNEAIERAALVTVDRYRITLDLTSSETTFRSTTTVEFEALPGADTAIDLAADTVHSALFLNGHSIDVSGYDESTGIPLKAWPHRTSSWSRRTAGTPTPARDFTRFIDPVDDEVYLYSQFRRPTPNGCSPVSISRISKPSSMSPSPPPATGR